MVLEVFLFSLALFDRCELTKMLQEGNVASMANNV